MRLALNVRGGKTKSRSNTFVFRVFFFQRVARIAVDIVVGSIEARPAANRNVTLEFQTGERSERRANGEKKPGTMKKRNCYVCSRMEILRAHVSMFDENERICIYDMYTRAHAQRDQLENGHLVVFSKFLEELFVRVRKKLQ